MWTFEYILSQIFVVLGSTSLAIAYFVKSKKKILMLNILATLFFISEYLLLKINFAVIINVIGLIRCIWFNIDDKKQNYQNYVSLIVVLILCLAGFYGVRVWYDTLPAIAALIITYGVWQNNVLTYRVCALAMDSLFLLFNIFNTLVAGIVIESIMCLAGILGIIRYILQDLKNNKLFNNLPNNEIKIN